MKICLINGSIKEKRSTSGYLLDQLHKRLDKSAEIIKMDWKDLVDTPPALCDVLVLAFPLYIDSVPSNLLDALEKSESVIAESNREAKVYTMINNAFYEPSNDRFAVRIIQHWCENAGLIFGGAMCLGAGPMATVSPPGEGPMKDLGTGLDSLAWAINNNQKSSNDLYLKPGIPVSDYLNNANQNWTKAAEKRGLTTDDLLRKL